jgi:hypothetical protein
VVSVLLAGVVTFFAINVTSTRVQEESLNLTYQHVWFSISNNTQGAQAAVLVTNTGGRDVVIQKVTIRGQLSPWANVIYNITSVAPTTDLPWLNSTGNPTSMIIGSTNYTLKTTSTNLVLSSGNSLILYVNSPDSITVNDVGLTVAMTIFTAQAMYYKETNVQAQ